VLPGETKTRYLDPQVILRRELYPVMEHAGISRVGPTGSSELVDAVADAGLPLTAGSATASDSETVETYALGALVGSAAERRLSGSDNLGTADREAVIGLAFRLLDHSVWSAQEWRDSLLSDAREFVETHWEEIELLAAALLQQTTLTSSKRRRGHQEGTRDAAEVKGCFRASGRPHLL
jgi:hypothetical protein